MFQFTFAPSFSNNLQNYRPAMQTDVIGKYYQGDNYIKINHSNSSIVLVVTSLCFACLHLSSDGTANIAPYSSIQLQKAMQVQFCKEVQNLWELLFKSMLTPTHLKFQLTYFYMKTYIFVFRSLIFENQIQILVIIQFFTLILIKPINR